jgi:hypothetical protein
MYILRIEHAVSDYEAWKATFDSDPIGRERSGVRRYRIMRPTDDPSHVMFELEYDSSGEAEAVRAALEDPTSPPDVAPGLRVRINEVMETKKYYLSYTDAS